MSRFPRVRNPGGHRPRANARTGDAQHGTARGEVRFETDQQADRDARGAHRGHVRRGPQPDGGDPGPAVGHGRDVGRRVDRPVADHGIHPGQRHHDPHHRLPARPLLHTHAVHGIDGHLRRRQPPRRHRPQLPRAADRPPAAGRRRRCAHAHGADGAHAHVPAREAWQRHGHLRPGHRLRTCRGSQRRRLGDRHLQLAYPVLRHHRPLRGGACRGPRPARAHREPQRRGHARQTVGGPLHRRFRPAALWPKHHRLGGRQRARHRPYRCRRRNHRRVLRPPAQARDADAQRARPGQPQLPRGHRHRHARAGRPVGRRRAHAHLPAELPRLFGHALGPGHPARRRADGRHGHLRGPHVRQARTPHAEHRGPGPAQREHPRVRLPGR